MDSPPPFAPTSKKRSPALIVAIVIGALGLCCVLPIALFGGLGMFAWTQGKGMVQCTMTMAIAQAAILDYEKEKGVFPKAETWQTDIAPYYDKAAVKLEEPGMPFKVPKATDEWVCNTDGAVTGIAYNSEMSGKKIADLKERMRTVVLFEVEKARMNASEPFKERDAASSPKIFGKPRGWLKVRLEDKEARSKSGSLEIKTSTSDKE